MPLGPCLRNLDHQTLQPPQRLVSRLLFVGGSGERVFTMARARPLFQKGVAVHSSASWTTGLLVALMASCGDCGGAVRQDAARADSAGPSPTVNRLYEQYFPVTPTMQTACYDDTTAIPCTAFPCLSNGAPDFCGQDPQYPHRSRAFTCYNEAKAETPCASVPAADTEEVVTDSLTGLMWQRTWTTNLTWQQALDHCDTVNFGGYSDWRLPSPHELRSLVNGSRINPAVDGTAFPWPYATILWSSAPYVVEDFRAWAVTFSHGDVIADMKSIAESALCVRAGPELAVGSANRFAEIITTTPGEPAIIDEVTQRVWAKIDAVALTWRQALAYCEALDYGKWAIHFAQVEIHT